MSKDRSYLPDHMIGQESVYDEAHGPAKKKRKLAHKDPPLEKTTITLKEWREQNAEHEKDTD